ncbi:MAG: YidC/Oxa1 family rane protein insertase [Thermosediminibacterales bacterium]|nr:YidC/Oxa1 family rane protein insertase [Thermosediminibacterales bacterium]MDK2835702.1 YidC/Oxa1 family rane protein insertase [Thermosediminibacterales bacterium]
MIAYLANIMKQVLDFLFVYTKSYGISIILLTIFIKVILLPLTFKQMQSMKKMQEIAPLQKKLQEKYKNDKEKLNKEIMELYRKNNVNPAAGCLPLLIQFPFLIALFRLLQQYDFGEAGFLWISNLGAPDTTYILPILAGLTTYISSKMASPDSSQQTMTIFMSVFIAWMSTRFASGLALYWVVSNIFQLLQQIFVTRPFPRTKEESS